MYPSSVTFILWIIGTILIFIGGSFMCAGRYFLGKGGVLIITIEEDHKLVTNGPYSLVRHPIYSGIIFLFLGYTLSFCSIIGTVIITSFFIFWFRKRIELEERMLIQKYGYEYLSYMNKTSRLIPFIY